MGANRLRGGEKPPVKIGAVVAVERNSPIKQKKAALVGDTQSSREPRFLPRTCCLRSPTKTLPRPVNSMIRQPFSLTVTRPIRRKGDVVNTCACLTRIVLRHAFPQKNVAAQRNVPALPPEHSPRAPCVLRNPSKIEARVSPPRFVR